MVAGTTLGMLTSKAPAVVFGHRFAGRLPTRWARAVAALLSLALGGRALRTALAAPVLSAT